MLAVRLARRQLVASVNSFGVRALSAAPAPSQDDGDDFVLSTFKEQQHQYRALMDGIKKLDPPLGGNEAAVKKYAEEMEALRKKVGLPDHAEVAEAVLDFKLKASGGDVRSFLTTAMEDRAEASGELAGVADELFAAIDAVEQENGPLSPENQPAYQALAKRVEEIEANHGLKPFSEVKNNKEVVYELYKEQLEQLKAKATEDMESVKRKDHLDFVQVDPSGLKLTPI